MSVGNEVRTPDCFLGDSSEVCTYYYTVSVLATGFDIVDSTMGSNLAK